MAKNHSSILAGENIKGWVVDQQLLLVLAAFDSLAYPWESDSLNALYFYISEEFKSNYLHPITQVYREVLGGLNYAYNMIPPDGEYTVYPNPFNPMVTIKIQTNRYVKEYTLLIYDLLGRKLYSVHKDIGYNAVDYVYWGNGVNGQNNLPSGIYFMVLKVGENFQKQKLIFLK